MCELLESVQAKSILKSIIKLTVFEKSIILIRSLSEHVFHGIDVRLM